MVTPVRGPSALLVIDVQCALFGAKPPPLEADAVIRKINDLTARARKAVVPVYFIQHDGNEEDGVVPLTPGWQLWPDLQTDPQDRFLRKTTCDAFFETALESQLRSSGIENVVIAGYATEFCIDSTVRNATSKGFRVFVAADAHTTNDNQVLKADKIRELHNWVWAHCTAEPPITVAKVSEIQFNGQE
jgi:nicotinamidase-related amidase